MATGCEHTYKHWPQRGETCGREVWADDLCIGHHLAPKGEAAFRQTLDAKVNANDWDYQEWIFPWDVNFPRSVVINANFSGATFQRQASFWGHTFQGEANFWFARFQGQANFEAATFQGKADFSGVTFQEGVRFWGADVQELTVRGAYMEVRPGGAFREVGFRGGTFQGEASFSGATFQEVADFQRVTFQEGAWFGGATFQEGAWFSGATFQGQASFGGTTFQREANFSGATFQEALFESTDFQDSTSFRAADLTHATFRAISRAQNPPRSLEHVSFRYATGLEQAVFEDVDWARWQGREFVTGDELDARESGKREDFAAAEAVYRGLRRSYETRKDFMRANELYYGEMEMRREQVGRQQAQAPAREEAQELPPGVRGLYQRLRRTLLSWGWWRRNLLSLIALYWLFSGYGTRWRRALFWYGAVLLLFTLGYAAVGYEMVLREEPTRAVLYSLWQPLPGLSFGVPGKDFESGTVRLLLHSFRTTLLQREPELQPLLWTGFLFEGLETALGPILLFLLGLCVRRRFQR